MDSVVNKNWLKIFAGKRILVTGDTGFKGSWLSLWLHQLGADVVGYALPPEREHDHFNLLGLGRIIRHIDGDIRDCASIAKVADEFQPEFLFHLAAQPLVRFSYDEPKLTFDTNVGGSVNLLEIARTSSSLRAMIYVTSDKCYKNNEWIWGYRENDVLGGRDPYSASKAAAEIVFEAYSRSFFETNADFGAATVRAGNVIGGGDWAMDRIVPDCIKALRAEQPLVLRNPTATRPWQHVLEPLSGYLQLAARLYEEPKKYSGAWNFGPHDEAIRTVQELAEKLVEHWGSGEIQIQAQDNAPHEARLLHLSCDKAHHVLSWIPRWNFERTMRETAEWYKQEASGINALQLSTQQLHAYMESL